MLSLIVFLPAAAAVALLAVPGRTPRAVFVWAWIGVSAADLALVAAAWAGYRPARRVRLDRGASPGSPPRVSATTSASTGCPCR